MRGCNNSKIRISSNFILSICLLIMFITLQHLATLNHTTPNYTSLQLSTLHFLSFTLHYSPIWPNTSTFPIVLFHLTSLSWLQETLQELNFPEFAIQNLKLKIKTFHIMCAAERAKVRKWQKKKCKPTRHFCVETIFLLKFSSGFPC